MLVHREINKTINAKHVCWINIKMMKSKNCKSFQNIQIMEKRSKKPPNEKINTKTPKKMSKLVFLQPKIYFGIRITKSSRI